MIKGYKNLNEYLDLIGKLSSINQRKFANNKFNPSLYINRIKRQEDDVFLRMEDMVKQSVINGEYENDYAYRSPDTVQKTNIIDTIWETNITKAGRVTLLFGKEPVKKEVKVLCRSFEYITINFVREDIPYAADLYFDIPEEKKQELEGGGPDACFHAGEYLYGVFYLEFFSHIYKHVIGVSEFFKKECLQYAKYSKFEMLNMIKKAQGLEQLPSKPKPTLKIK